MPLEPLTDILLHGSAWALSLGGAIYWLMVWVRVRRARRTEPTAADGLRCAEPATGWPTVSIVIPAHNEARVIEESVRRLIAQDYPALSIIYVLDRCTDDTRARLERGASGDARVTIIELDHCPDDWAGKCHAAHNGARVATGAYLLFTDADTGFAPELVRAAMGLAIERNLDLLSLLSTLSTQRWFERLVQPVATMTLMSMYPLDRVNRETAGRAFANGQFLLFRRAMYEQLGGHEGVKEYLLEDMAFARATRRAKGRLGVYFSAGLLRCSMYDSFETFRLGWKRIYIECCRRKPARLRKMALRAWLLGLGVPLGQATALVLGVNGLTRGEYALAAVNVALVMTGWVMQAIAQRLTYQLADAPRWAALLHPVGATLVGSMLWAGARDLVKRRPVRWGGRSYTLEPR